MFERKEEKSGGGCRGWKAGSGELLFPGVGVVGGEPAAPSLQGLFVTDAQLEKVPVTAVGYSFGKMKKKKSSRGG